MDFLTDLCLWGIWSIDTLKVWEMGNWAEKNTLTLIVIENSHKNKWVTLHRLAFFCCKKKYSDPYAKLLSSISAYYGPILSEISAVLLLFY